MKPSEQMADEVEAEECEHNTIPLYGALCNVIDQCPTAIRLQAQVDTLDRLLKAERKNSDTLKKQIWKCMEEAKHHD